MTVANGQQAIDEMFSLLNVAWLAGTTAVAGYVPELRWQGKELATKPDPKKYWARASVQRVTEEQATISNCVDAPGQKRFEIGGFLMLQIFCPKIEIAAQVKGAALAEVAKRAFRGKHTSPGNVWFHNVRINELKPDDSYVRFNVVAEFEFDEIG